jgi:hypothetical protein
MTYRRKQRNLIRELTERRSDSYDWDDSGMRQEGREADGRRRRTLMNESRHCSR